MVVHDVPVNVIPRRLWDEYEEPEMPRFDVSSTKTIYTTLVIIARLYFLSL